MSHKDCIEFCPEYEICQRLVKKGETAILQAALSGYGASDAEFETEDGQLIAGWQMEKSIPPEAADALLSGGGELIASGRELGNMLLQGCTEGPLQLGSGKHLCQSTNKNIGITQEDIDAAG